MQAIEHDGMVAAVAGATSGIGAATVRRFAAAGTPVVACGRRSERLAELERAFEGDVRLVRGVCGDVRQPDIVTKMFVCSEQEWHRQPSVFVLCAGRGLPGTILSSDCSAWQQLIEINYVAVLTQLRQVANLLLAQAEKEGGSTARDIIVVGSTIGRTLSAHNPVYGSTKFAVHALVESLRQEVCERNIRVSLIEPGFVKSEFQETAGYDRQWFESIEQQSGPLLVPDDIAKLVEFIVRQPAHVHVDDLRIRPTRQKV